MDSLSGVEECLLWKQVLLREGVEENYICSKGKVIVIGEDKIITCGDFSRRLHKTRDYGTNQNNTVKEVVYKVGIQILGACQPK